MTSPRVSVCVPTLDRAASLGRTLRSVAGQEFSDLEIVVVDNASAGDDTRRTVEALGDTRVRYLRQPARVSMGANWNRCLAEATGAYVSIYHDDDSYEPGMVAAAVALLEAERDLAFVHSATLHVNEQGSPIRVCDHGWPPRVSGAEFRRRIALRPGRGQVEAQTVMARREVWLAAGRFREDWLLAADVDMWLRMAGLGAVGYIATPLARVTLRASASEASERVVQMMWEKAEVVRAAAPYLGDGLAGKRDRALQRVRLETGILEGLLWLAARGGPELARAGLERMAEHLSLPARAAARAMLSGPTAPWVARAAGAAAFVRRWARGRP